mmetsp:Transcript_40241/g.106567  ORF Transcript_40241/g.106567 Transcript_40241/m.106567 type:complete len:260 (+) Transcript_40241:980-1759(+)
MIISSSARVQEVRSFFSAAALSDVAPPASLLGRRQLPFPPPLDLALFFAMLPLRPLPPPAVEEEPRATPPLSLPMAAAEVSAVVVAPLLPSSPRLQNPESPSLPPSRSRSASPPSPAVVLVAPPLPAPPRPFAPTPRGFGVSLLLLESWLSLSPSAETIRRACPLPLRRDSWRRLHRLRTASSDLPGSCAAITRQRQPRVSTPWRMRASSSALHSFRGKADTCSRLFLVGSADMVASCSCFALISAAATTAGVHLGLGV